MKSSAREFQNPKSLRPPQFGLRTLLALITAAAVLLALRQWVSPIAITAIAIFAASIFLHVSGNAIGTRLRQIGDLPDDPAANNPLQPFRRAPKPQDFAPATHLGQKTNLGWMIIVASSVGATTGAVGGGLWTFVAARGHAEPLNIVIGVIAFAVLGGMAAFATFGFVQVLGGAIRQAVVSSSPASDSRQNLH
jgi:hypothetical protein